MNGMVGDRVVVESERVAKPPRTGVIEEILHPESPCYRIRWDDGHTSIITPAAGTMRIEERTGKGGVGHDS